MTNDESATPILDGLLKDGTVYVDGASYIGIAHDEVEVSLGSIFNAVWTERYLRDHPTPKDW